MMFGKSSMVFNGAALSGRAYEAFWERTRPASDRQILGTAENGPGVPCARISIFFHSVAGTDSRCRRRPTSSRTGAPSLPRSGSTVGRAPVRGAPAVRSKQGYEPDVACAAGWVYTRRLFVPALDAAKIPAPPVKIGRRRDDGEHRRRRRGITALARRRVLHRKRLADADDGDHENDESQNHEAKDSHGAKLARQVAFVKEAVLCVGRRRTSMVNPDFGDTFERQG